ncbi:CaiB/BaiF CoA transferase family protein [Rubrobacter indicoceani]|uniref:CaiB/BaiF CoA transferase family protein n=1 Tax=Rubrobacter indicoceani TaxID=2051957 RepID=UPI000E5A1C8D|nr:CoA transferase [Rubrobacter indicoceani]
MSLPLEGLRVLDLSRVLAGPYATMLLADLGADVIKVEHPGHGDDTRGWGPPFVGDESAYFMSANRNKRSTGVDLKTDKGLAKIKQLAASADVLIENMRRGTLAKLGLGYEALKETNPGLVYCSITGFGPGPDRDRPGYDFLVQARAGVMGITGWPDGEPTKVGVAVADMVCGLYASNAILAALHKRAGTGEGSNVEVPLFETTLSWLGNRAQEFLVTGEDTGRMGNEHPTLVPYQTFRTEDRTIAVACGNDAQFQKLCKSIGRTDLADDGRFTKNSGRVENREALVPELRRTFLERGSEEWISTIKEAGVPCGPVNTLAQVFEDEHVLESGILREVEHPAAGTVRMLASPLILDGERPGVRKPPPTLGEHTDSAGWKTS